MIYKITKHVKRTLKQSNISPYNYEIDENKIYSARRKGTIFGFWHIVGHVRNSYDNGVLEHCESTLEGMKDYVEKYHKVYFPNSGKCKIIEAEEIL